MPCSAPLRAMALGVALSLPTAAAANDSMVLLSAGGLEFVALDQVAMESEELFLSRDEVRVLYSFRNLDEEDRSVLVGFPLPDIEPDYFAPVAWPQGPDDNLFLFETLFDGRPVEAELHAYAFAAGIDRTALLRELGLPLHPMGEEALAAVNALPPETALRLYRLGLLLPEYHDVEALGSVPWWPSWTLRSAYSWEAVFPAGRSVTVEHRYRPSVGGTVGVAFLALPEARARYAETYCLDDALVEAVRESLEEPDQIWSAPFTETWLSYILTTGQNWAGPIGSFRLVVDKGRADSLLSFCWDGELRAIDETRVEARAEDFFPHRELEVLILDRRPE